MAANCYQSIIGNLMYGQWIFYPLLCSHIATLIFVIMDIFSENSALLMVYFNGLIAETLIM